VVEGPWCWNWGRTVYGRMLVDVECLKCGLRRRRKSRLGGACSRPTLTIELHTSTIFIDPASGRSFGIQALTMAFPYTYISCPCTDVSTPINGSKEPQNDEDDEQERTFDPRSSRANFSLYTIQHLLYCEDCQQIRCPRCTIEEIVAWYCPSCLFEMPSSMVKSEAGR